jgi:predicted DNA-binding transcriptional regulator AlpA
MEKSVSHWLWWPGAESNHRHADFQAAGLPFVWRVKFTMLRIFKEFRGSKRILVEHRGSSEPAYWSRIWSKRHKLVRATRINTPFALLRVIHQNLERAVEEMIDQHDVAEYLGVSTRTVRTFIKRGALPPPIRIGRKQFWLKDKFTRWLYGGGIVSDQMRSARDVVNSVPRRGRTSLPAWSAWRRLVRASSRWSLGALNARDSLQGFHNAHHGTIESNQKGTFPAGVEVTGKYGFHPRFLGHPFVHQSLHGATEFLAKLSLRVVGGGETYGYGVHDA